MPVLHCCSTMSKISIRFILRSSLEGSWDLRSEKLSFGLYSKVLKELKLEKRSSGEMAFIRSICREELIL